MKTNFRTSICTLALFLTIQVYSQRPTAEGEVQKGWFTLGQCSVASLTAKYRLSALVGEPTVFVNIKWQPSSGSTDDCLGNENFHTFLKIYANIYSSYYYILADGALGVIPKGNNTYGYNPIPGSPDWDQLFMRNPSKNQNTNDWDYISADQAKYIWRNGIQVSGIEFKND